MKILALCAATIALFALAACGECDHREADKAAHMQAAQQAEQTYDKEAAKP